MERERPQGQATGDLADQEKTLNVLLCMRRKPEVFRVEEEHDLTYVFKVPGEW